MTNPQKLTESGLAREFGVSRQAIHDLVKRGILTKDADGLIDVEEARAALANLHPSSKIAKAVQSAAPSPATPPPEPSPHPAEKQGTEITSFHVARTLRESEEARMAKLKRMSIEKSLIDKDGAVRAAFTCTRMFRDDQETIGRRTGAKLAAMFGIDPHEATLVINEEIRQSWSRQAQRLQREITEMTGEVIEIPAEIASTFTGKN